MSDNNTKFIKGITVKENSLTPKEIEIIPGGTAGTKTTVQGSQTVDQTITLPNATDTLVGKATVDILTNKTIVVANNTITTAASGNLTATELNSALSELQTDIDTRALAADLTNHINDTTDAHDASAISVVPSGNLTSTDVQAALIEIQLEVDGNTSGLSAHINDTTDAHDGSAISYVPGIGTNLTANNVQGAIDESNINFLAHVTDSSNAHEASAISSIPFGNLLASDVQAALYELQADVDTRAPSATAVTLTGVQALTNKDYDGGSASNTSRLTLPKGTKAALDALSRKQGTLLYATDEDKVYYDNGTVLQAVGSGASTLQQVYLNSTLPQLSLNSTQGALTIADASSPIGTIFEVRNNAGTVSYFKVDTTGASTTNFTGVGTVGAVRVHNLTTTQRDALTPQPGMIVYNTTINQLQAYVNGSWGEMDRENSTSQTSLNNGDSILISANHVRQVVRVDGATGPVTLSGVPFFNAGGFLNNTEVEVIGMSDERAVTFVTSDVFKGLMGFSFTLGKNQVARLTYNAIVGRWLILSFSN